MHILYLFPGLAAGGAELRTLELCQALNSRGHTAMVACKQGPCIPIAGKAGIQCHLLPFRKDKPDPLTALHSIASLIRIIRRNQVEVVVTFRRSMALIAHCVSRFSSIPHVYMNVSVFGDKPWLRWTGDFTIANSSACLTNAVDYLRAVPARCKLIYRGVTVPDVLPSRNESRRRLQIPDLVPLIGTVARMVVEKGHRFLLRSMVRVRQEFEDAILLVIGDGEQKPQLEAECDALGLPKASVIFMGQRSDVWEILPALDICALASTELEGLPHSLLEAAACGIPLIGTAVGGIPEIIENGVNGLLVPPRSASALADAVVRLLGNREASVAMGRRARQMVAEKFSREREINEHLAVLETVVQTYRRRNHAPRSSLADQPCGAFVHGHTWSRSIRQRAKCHSNVVFAATWGDGLFSHIPLPRFG